MANELVIKISGNVEDFKSKLSEMQQKTKDLTGALQDVGVKAGIAFAGLTASIGGAIATYSAQEQAQLRTASVIKATGQAAGVTAQEVFNLASSLENVTTYGDQTIIAAENMLLTFKNIGKNVFPQATKAVLDMATAMGQDLTSTSIQVGKALQDPILGAIALRRVGVQLSEAQQDLIRTMVDTNNIAGAQAVILKELESEFGGAAEAAAQGTGQLVQLKNIIVDVVEIIGKELFQSLTGAVSVAKSFFQTLKENKGLTDAIVSTLEWATAITGLVAGLAAVGFGAIKLSALIVTLDGVFLSGAISASAFWAAALGPVGIAVAAIVAVGAAIAGVAYIASQSEEPKALKSINDELDEKMKRLDEIKKLIREGSEADKEYYQRDLDFIKKDIAQLEELRQQKIKNGEVDNSRGTGLGVLSSLQGPSAKSLDTSLTGIGNQTPIPLLNPEDAARASYLEDQAAQDAAKKRRDAEEKANEEILKERKKLNKDLIDAGKDELTKLQDIRDRRIVIAGNDKNLLLLIEKDYQEKKLELERKNDEKLREFRDAQFEYEKKLAKERLEIINKAAASPLQGLLDAQKEKDLDKKNAGSLGAGAGLLNNVGQGKEGAKNLVVEGAALGIDAFAPGIGQALKPLLGQLTQGPEATKAFVKEFADAVPDIIESLIDSIPVLIEAIANQTPVIIDRLVQKVPDIIGALVKSAPDVIKALVLESPKIILALIQNVPTFISSFIDGLISGAGEFVNALIDAINPLSSDGPVGGLVGGIGDIFGFAEGGQGIKKVPSGFSGDKFPAMLSSNELIIKPKVADQLERFLDNGGGQSSNGSILTEILKALKNPMQVNSSVKLNSREFANIVLDLSRSNARLA